MCLTLYSLHCLLLLLLVLVLCCFFNDTATTEIYTLSLHDALPIYPGPRRADVVAHPAAERHGSCPEARSEEHTSELQSQSNLACRLLLGKKNGVHARGRCPRPGRHRTRTGRTLRRA